MYVCRCPNFHPQWELRRGLRGHIYWAVHWSWYARVNALCTLSRKKSREVAASPLGRFLSRRCFKLCITMEVEPKIAKQYKCHHCCSCKNYRGKGGGGWEKSVFASFFGWPEDREFVVKMPLGASYSTSNKLLLIARHILTTGLEKAFKVGSVKFADSLSWRKYAPEVKAAKGLKQCRAKVKRINNPAWTAQYPYTTLKQKKIAFSTK